MSGFFKFFPFSEKQKISHYIIMDVNGMYFKIGEQRFADIASIIEFYKQHMIDTTMLTDPVISNLYFKFYSCYSFLKLKFQMQILEKVLYV